MKNIGIPETTIERLPLYYRSLQKLNKQNVEVISSKNLGKRLGLPSTQVRKDLSYYGEFGRRGVGYEVSVLIKQLEKILGLNKSWALALVGAGNLGHALLDYHGFRKLGLNIRYVFERDQEKIGEEFNGIKVRDIKNMEEVIEKNEIKIAIIAVPAEVAQEIADRLIAVGVKAIWNFAPTYLQVPEDIKLKNEDLSIGLVGLTYHLSDYGSE
ncbi:redox-sensing transcriptional repressor Rex [Natroniella acetigena]|uniref:redox-sensing transcriptional repressor Rex n=1 Tax=Natroniella acetigena TaxID=52004 RepID=UPI00200B7596|nr:redox-sensing transcriptional repressor Rex [Natroniella acetigena]MCK8828310.1 redox-sensing transcriptional repressor Rex [Natroniella acetigena]